MAITEELKRASDLLSSGDVAAARSHAEAAVKAEPANPVALQFLGIICCQAGDLQKGATYLARAAHARPDDLGIRFNLAKALLDLGRVDQADGVCGEQAIPGTVPADIWRLRAEIYKAQGRPADAIRAYRSVVAIDAGDFQSWNNLGNLLLAQGNEAEGSAALDTARRLQPDQPIIHLNLARALAAEGRHSESIASFAEAVRLAPEEASHHLELGHALNELGRHQEALVALSHAARLNPNEPSSFVHLGLTFASLGEVERAEEGYRVAMHVDSRHRPAYLNLGILLEQANRIDELEQLVQHAQAQDLEGGEIDYIRALLLRRQGRLPEALAIAREIPTDAVNAEVRAQLVGQIADRLDDPATAFAAFAEMNRATATGPSAARFDGTEYRAHVAELARLTTAEWLASWPETELPDRPASPVFLIGFPRSGTTLLDTLLMSHPSTHVLEEEPILGQLCDELGGIDRIGEATPEQVRALRQGYFRRLEAISPPAPGKIVIDKLPLNTLRLPLIHRLFPDAKILFAQRHPCDVVLSCFMQNFKINRAMASFLDLENAALLYDGVLGYWQQCSELMPLDSHVVRYESMVADMEAEVRPLLKFLGLRWDPAILDYRRTAEAREMIRTPSYAQVTEEIYHRARGRWQRYRSHMEKVLPILEPWAIRLGYGPIAPSQTGNG